MSFIGLTPLSPERLCSIIHLGNKGYAERFVSGIPAQDHLAIQFRQCGKEPITIPLPDFAEDDNIRMFRMLELIAEMNRYLMPDEQLIGKVLRHVNKRVMVIPQRESFKCKIVFIQSSAFKNACLKVLR